MKALCIAAIALTLATPAAAQTPAPGGLTGDPNLRLQVPADSDIVAAAKDCLVNRVVTGGGHTGLPATVKWNAGYEGCLAILLEYDRIEKARGAREGVLEEKAKQDRVKDISKRLPGVAH